MIKDSLSLEQAAKITFIANRNVPASDAAWVENIVQSVHWHTKGSDRIMLMDSRKPNDGSVYYLDLFPWNNHVIVPQRLTDATSVRKAYFNSNPYMAIQDLPMGTYNFLHKFAYSPDYYYVQDEIKGIAAAIEDGKRFTNPSVTVDNVIVRGDDVLLIKRKHSPGKGLWALPGGFLDINSDYDLEAAAKRELKEKTGIVVPYYDEEKVFSQIGRSSRGRTITQAFLGFVDYGVEAVAGDDAADFKWQNLEELDSSEMFEDHFHIVKYWFDFIP